MFSYAAKRIGMRTYFRKLSRPTKQQRVACINQYSIQSRTVSTETFSLPKNLNIGVIGFGKIASAMVNGFINSELIDPKNITASNRTPRDAALAQTSCGINYTTANREVVAKSRVIIVAVKPNMVQSVLSEIAPLITPEHTVVSVAAGISLEFMESFLPATARVVRVMPNTPCLVMCGASVFTLGKRASREDGQVVRTLMVSTGLCEEVTEDLIDAVTGVSGSGPAWWYLALEAMSDAGVKLGMPRDQALRLAAQTMMGSAKMVLESDSSPAVLKDQVTSPGGTTIHGLHILEENKFRGILMSTVEATANRSKELMDIMMKAQK